MKFELPECAVNRKSIGPSPDMIPEIFKQIPYAPFAKTDKISRVADWYESEETSTGRRPRKTNEKLGNPSIPVQEIFGAGTSTAFSYIHQQDEEVFLKKKVSVPTPAWTSAKKIVSSAKSAPTQQKPLVKAKSIKRPANWSEKITVEHLGEELVSEWTLVESYPLNVLNKLTADEVEPENLLDIGVVNFYDRQFDRILAKTEKQLITETRSAFYVKTLNDIVFKEIQSTKKIKGRDNFSNSNMVYGSSQVFAALATAARSVSGFDIVVKKITDANTGKSSLYFDKRLNSPLDLISVHETAGEPLQDVLGDPEHVCSPSSFAFEATMVQKRFVDTVVLKSSKGLELKDGRYPGDNNAHIGFRYRKFSWESSSEDVGKIDLIVRGEVDSVISSANDNHLFLNLYALSEHIPVDPQTGMIQSSYSPWRAKIDHQRGAIIATEIKNNSWKLARWTLQSLLSGTDQMKFGFVSRISPLSPGRGYTILGVQFYKPLDFCPQLNIDMSNIWGVIKSWIEILLQKEDGTYAIVKNDGNSYIRFYRVNQDCPIPGYNE